MTFNCIMPYMTKVAKTLVWLNNAHVAKPTVVDVLFCHVCNDHRTHYFRYCIQVVMQEYVKLVRVRK